MDIFYNIVQDEGYKLFIPELWAYSSGHVNIPREGAGTLIQYGINGCTAVSLGPSFKV